jgi:hypothetical protein
MRMKHVPPLCKVLRPGGISSLVAQLSPDCIAACLDEANSFSLTRLLRKRGTTPSR